jgi:hypothetical protein
VQPGHDGVDAPVAAGDDDAVVPHLGELVRALGPQQAGRPVPGQHGDGPVHRLLLRRARLGVDHDGEP